MKQLIRLIFLICLLLLVVASLAAQDSTPEATTDDLMSELVRQVKEEPHEVALKAINELRTRGYLGEFDWKSNIWSEGALTGQNLSGVDLQKADLHNANLHGTNLYGANLQGALLIGSDLGGANFAGANLQRAVIDGAKLDNDTVLPDANCKWHDDQWTCNSMWIPSIDMIRFIDSKHPDFWRGFEVSTNRDDLAAVDLHSANLQAAWLVGADLHNANLKGTNLYGANLLEASLIGADLRGANLASANLTGAVLDGVKFDTDTVLPDAICERENNKWVCEGMWTLTTNMASFTDPTQPDFWHPDWVPEISIDG